MSTKKKSNKGKKKAKKSQSSSSVFLIPQRDVGNSLYGQVARWETNTALSNFALNVQKVIACLNVMAATSTTVWSTYFAVRIKKIIFYTPANVTSVSSNGSAEWFAPSGTSLGIKPSSMTAGSLGTASGSKITMIPPEGTIWENWITLLSPGSVTMLVFSMPSNTIIDIIYDAYIDNGDGTVGFSTVGASVGSNYRMGLDCLQTSLTNFVPVGYKAI